MDGGLGWNGAEGVTREQAGRDEQPKGGGALRAHQGSEHARLLHAVVVHVVAGELGGVSRAGACRNTAREQECPHVANARRVKNHQAHTAPGSLTLPALPAPTKQSHTYWSSSGDGQRCGPARPAEGGWHCGGGGQ